jgi:predicted kinase
MEDDDMVHDKPTGAAPGLATGAVPRVLLLTGTCGSGKSTIAARLGARPGWTRISEDDVWAERIGRDRGVFGTPGHRENRRIVHRAVFAALRAAVAGGLRVALDATVHESPPESFEEYRAFFREAGIPWALRVLHPRLDVAVARDGARSGARLGPDRVASLRAKFTARALPFAWFLDTSADTPEDTVRRLVEAGLA